MGRSPNCSVCKQLKEPGRDNESCCKACKAKRRSAKLAKKRIDAGLRPYKSGRMPYCCLCGSTKENDDSGYCNKCKRDTAKVNRLEAKKNPNFVFNERQKKREIRERNEFERLKRLAHIWVHRAVKAGKMIRQPCEICGVEKVDAHHDDYWKPFEVRWLCRSHHREHHERNKDLNLEEYLL